MEALKSTLLHALELAVVLVGTFVILTQFGVDSDSVQLLVGIAIGALAKFARASESVPVKDYVNE